MQKTHFQFALLTVNRTIKEKMPVSLKMQSWAIIYY